MCLPEQGHDQLVSGQLRAELEAVAYLAALVGQDVEQIPGSEVRAPDGLEAWVDRHQLETRGQDQQKVSHVVKRAE